MSSATPSIPAVIDVDAEVRHWRQRHADGNLGPGSFGHYVPWIKFACDCLITHPRASDEQRDEMFQTHYALMIMPRLSQAQARDFVEQCWQHVYQAGHQDSSAQPRPGARA